jgi:hypothetical protein
MEKDTQAKKVDVRLILNISESSSKGSKEIRKET